MPIPPAVLGQISGLVEFLAEAMTLSGATKRGLITMAGIEIILAIAKRSAIIEEKEFLENFERLRADFSVAGHVAEDEIANLFPSVSVHNAVETWGAIESTVENALAFLFENIEGAIVVIKAEIASEKTRRRIDSASSARDVLVAWEGALKDKPNVMDRIIAMFGAFGIHVSLTELHRTRLTELSEVRNVLLHRRGVIDPKFLSKCPWRTEAVGDKLVINHVSMHDYFESAIQFAIELSSATVAAIQAR